jgi:branched-chain amino acid transport system permease protein
MYTYYLGIASYEMFQPPISIGSLAMAIIGGLGSVLSSNFGAMFVTPLPVAARVLIEVVGVYFVDGIYLAPVIAQMWLTRLGGLIIVLLILEPDGLNKLWQNIRNYFRVWLFPH